VTDDEGLQLLLDIEATSPAHDVGLAVFLYRSRTIGLKAHA
jgi:hypothetical protein